MARLASNRSVIRTRPSSLWQRVLDLRGEDPEALNASGDIYAGQGDGRDSVDVLEREAAIAEDDAFRVQVYSDLARVWYEKLERERNRDRELGARARHRSRRTPTRSSASLEIQRAGGQSRERADTLHRIIDVGAATLEDADLITVYMQLGHIYANELQQPGDAAEAYRNVLNIDPAYVEALDCARAHLPRRDDVGRGHRRHGTARARVRSSPRTRFGSSSRSPDVGERGW